MFCIATAPPYGDRLRGLLFVIGLRVGTRLQAVQESCSTFGMSGGGEDRALVVLQFLDPGVDIGGVILARLGREAEIGGEKGAAKPSSCPGAPGARQNCASRGLFGASVESEGLLVRYYLPLIVTASEHRLPADRQRVVTTRRRHHFP